MTISARPFAISLCLACLTMSAASAATFDAVTGFSLTTNVATNTWSYWGTTSTTIGTYASNVALLPVLFNGSCGSGTSCWDTSGGISNLVLQNVTGADADLRWHAWQYRRAQQPVGLFRSGRDCIGSLHGAHGWIVFGLGLLRGRYRFAGILHRVYRRQWERRISSVQLDRRGGGRRD